MQFNNYGLIRERKGNSVLQQLANCPLSYIARIYREGNIYIYIYICSSLTVMAHLRERGIKMKEKQIIVGIRVTRTEGACAYICYGKYTFRRAIKQQCDRGSEAIAINVERNVKCLFISI